MNNPVTELTFHSIWDKLLDSARISRYLCAMANRHKKLQLARRATEVIAGALAVSSFLWESHILLSIAGISILISALTGLFKFEKADALISLTSEMNMIEGNFRRLCELARNNKVSEDIAREQLDLLTHLKQAIEARVDIVHDKKLIQKCQEDAYEHELTKHAA